MAKKRIHSRKRDIVKYFDSLPPAVLFRKDINAILAESREIWHLPKSLTTDEFVDFLIDKCGLLKIELKSTYGSQVRFSWRKEPTPRQLALSLRPRMFLSHYSAMELHGLTEQILRTTYVNQEQSPKSRPKGALQQRGIDWAFQSRQRSSKLIYSYQEYRIVVLAGKNTGNTGVITIEDGDGGMLPTTSLERTLIDIAVRPDYAGGIHEVAKAYEEARGRVSTNRLVATLRKMDFVYPYHQAIGFLMDRAGFKEPSLRLLKNLGFEFDFYLQHGMKDKDYSEKWKLFYPKGL